MKAKFPESSGWRSGFRGFLFRAPLSRPLGVQIASTKTSSRFIILQYRNRRAMIEGEPFSRTTPQAYPKRGIQKKTYCTIAQASYLVNIMSNLVIPHFSRHSTTRQSWMLVCSVESYEVLSLTKSFQKSKSRIVIPKVESNQMNRIVPIICCKHYFVLVAGGLRREEVVLTITCLELHCENFIQYPSAFKKNNLCYSLHLKVGPECEDSMRGST